MNKLTIIRLVRYWCKDDFPNKPGRNIHIFPQVVDSILHLCATFLVIIAGGMMIPVSEARQQAMPTTYAGVGMNELVTVYKNAYLGAGFLLVKQISHSEGVPLGGRVKELIFEFPLPGYAHEKRGVTSFRIISSNVQNFAPCSVYSETFGKDIEQYDAIEWASAMPKVIGAANDANDQIRTKLNKSIQAEKLHPSRPDVDE